MLNQAPACGLALWLLTAATLLSCDSDGAHLTLTAEDYRFDPPLARAQAEQPLTLTVFNAGREVHEFASPLLAYARDRTTPAPAEPPAGSPVLTLEPGRSVRLLVVAPPGTYLYWCTRKGHPNMSGTLIVE